MIPQKSQVYIKRIENPPNPFESLDRVYFEGMSPPARLEVYEDQTRNILSENKSPDLNFRWSLNPYRGCAHACAYCYARPSHEYLGFGAGTDFETKIVIKRRAPELLRKTFLKPSWKGELITFSGDTDCYQPLEAHYQLTKGCLEVCLEFGNPITIITKSFLIIRDLELLKKLYERTHLSIVMSIPFLNDSTARLIEPHAASVSRRFDAVRILSEHGINVGVNIAPLIPGLNDSDIPQILKRTKECGGKSAGLTLLRLPGNVKAVFASRIRSHFPLAYQKIMGRIRQTRGGKLYTSEFGKRFEGTGEYWNNIEHVFDLYCEKLGLNQHRTHENRMPFKRPETKQLIMQL
ncbi:MAG: PA0069 family radical SAM protein [Candidatus Omnitrophica bacterium]|nr:PA0069 family radical SAM protein [Candidatus Omnitrophota bacterium]